MKKTISAVLIVLLFGMFFGSRLAMLVRGVDMPMIDYFLLIAGTVLMGLNWKPVHRVPRNSSE